MVAVFPAPSAAAQSDPSYLTARNGEKAGAGPSVTEDQTPGVRSVITVAAAAPAREEIRLAYQNALQGRAPAAAPGADVAAAPVAAAPVAEPTTPEPAIHHLDPDAIASLLKRADALIASGDVAAARLVLRRAADAGDARAAMTLAETYDPAFLEKLGVHGFVPDLAMARSWYEKARTFGSAEAPQRLETARKQAAITGGAALSWPTNASAKRARSAEFRTRHSLHSTQLHGTHSSAHHSKGQSHGRLHRDCQKSLRVPVVLRCFLHPDCPLASCFGSKPKAGSGVSYDEKKRQANDIAVTVVVSGISCTCARFTEDIRNVVNDLGPDGIRVLPVLGVGGLQNVNDVLFLKNIDMGVVDEDNLRLLKKKDPVLYANIEQRVQYITKLYNSEFQVLARNDIKSYDDLRGKKVNFNLKDSQTEVTADTVFNALNIPTQRSYYDNDEAMKRLISGEISAMIILTGAPQVTLSKVKKEDGVHFLPLDQESLPNHDLKELFANYLPADLTHDLYPNLIPEGTTVPTIANRALLVAYTWPENSPRYKQDRQVRRRVLQQDRSIQQLVEASEVARSQSFGRNAWLDAISSPRPNGLPPTEIKPCQPIRAARSTSPLRS